MTTAPVHRTVAGQGVRLAVAERGLEHETAIVMIHGWPDTKALWNPIADHLAADYHVVTYDVRGAGESGHPTERDAYRIEVLVEDLAAIIDATSTGPVHLVGHDWGAVQGWEAAGIDFGGRLASFTSISGPSLDHSGYAIRAQLRGGPRALVALADQVMRFGYILTFATPVPAVSWPGRCNSSSTTRPTLTTRRRRSPGMRPTAPRCTWPTSCEDCVTPMSEPPMSRSRSSRLPGTRS